MSGIAALPGAELAWSPNINQGLVRFIDPRADATPADHDRFTDLVSDAVVASGEAFFSNTTWRGQRCMRVSVCNWQTSAQDAERAVAAVAQVLASRTKNLDCVRPHLSAGMPVIAFESPDQPDVIALIGELDAYQDTLYPPESRYALDLASLKQPNVLFAVARDSMGEAIGCGAIVLCPEFGELKRMYVSPRGRGQGVARNLLAQLEFRAIAAGCKLLTLESGPYQHEALALYAGAGYERRRPYGDYKDDPLSVFMQKHLAR